MSRMLSLILCLLILSPSAYVAWQARDMPQFGRIHDDSIYFVSAKSIAEGHGYRILSLPGEPYQTKYPPLFPLLLTLVWKIQPEFPGNLQIAALVCWLMLPAFLATCWLFYKSLGLPEWQSLALICLLGLNFWVGVFSISVMPELMFVTLLIGSVILADKATEHSNSWEAFAAAVVASAAYLTRSAALPLLISVPLVLWLRKRTQCAVVFFLSMSVTVVGWNLWVYNHRIAVTDENDLFYLSYFGYFVKTEPLGDLPMMIVQNARTLSFSVAELLDMHGIASTLGALIQVSITVASLIGLFWMARRFKLSHYYAFAACYLPVLLLWSPRTRFVLPVIPILLGGLFLVIQESIKLVGILMKRDSALSVGASLAISVVLLISVGWLFVSYCSTPWMILPDGAQWRAQKVLRLPSYDYIKQHIPASSAFIAHEDPLFYLYTGHHARSLHSPTNLLDRSGFQAIATRYYSLAEFGREHNLDYLFFTPDDFYRESREDELRSIVRRVVQTGADFELLREDNGGSIYKMNKPGPPDVANGKR